MTIIFILPTLCVNRECMREQTGKDVQEQLALTGVVRGDIFSRPIDGQHCTVPLGNKSESPEGKGKT